MVALSAEQTELKQQILRFDVEAAQLSEELSAQGQTHPIMVFVYLDLLYLVVETICSSSLNSLDANFVYCRRGTA